MSTLKTKFAKLSRKEREALYDLVMDVYNIPRPGLIKSIRAKNLSTGIAVSEWIDNARRFRATKIELEFGSNYVTCRDNGNGTDDPSLLLGYGSTTAVDGQTDISRYGVGSKDGQLKFGLCTYVETVNAGGTIYRMQSIDWAEAEKRWPERSANLRVLPIVRAPKFIHDGGLALTVTNLDRKYRFGGWFEQLCEELTVRYLLAIENGLNITVIDAKEGKTQSLNADPSLLGITSFGKIEKGEAGGRRFELSYADMKQYNSRFGGINLYYDGRCIRRLLKLNKIAVPQSLFAQVKLSKDWRDQLTPNKQDILASSQEELSAALYPMLKEMMEILRSEQDDIAIAEVELAISGMLDNVVMLDPTKKGKFKPGPKIVVGINDQQGGDGPGPGPGPNPEEQTSAIEGDEAESKPLPQTRLGISVKPDPTPDPFIAYRYVLTEKDGSRLTVYVNRRDYPLIASAYLEPYKLNVLVGLAAAAFAEWATEIVMERPDGGMLAKMIETLNSKGAKIRIDMSADEQSAWMEFREKLAAFIVSYFELKKEEKDKLEAHDAAQGEDRAA